MVRPRLQVLRCAQDALATLADKQHIVLQNRSFARHSAAQDDKRGSMDQERLLEALLEERPEEIPERPSRDPVLYVKTRTIRSGELTEVECYPVYIGSYQRQLRKCRPTAEAVREINDRNARKKFQRMAECNFKAGEDYFLTLTYDGAAPEDKDQCDRDLRNYLSRVNRARKKLGLEKARAMGVIEVGEHGRLHQHLLIEGGLDRDKMEQLWRHGIANCSRIQQSKGGLAALKNYFTKCFDTKKAKRGKGRHRYFYTRNLKKPKEHVSDCKISNRKVKTLARYFRNEAKEIMEKIYPGYVLENGEVRYSDIVDGVYIFCIMRKKEDEHEDRPANRRIPAGGKKEKEDQPGPAKHPSVLEADAEPT